MNLCCSGSPICLLQGEASPPSDFPPRSRSRPPGPGLLPRPLRLTGPDPPARSPSRSLHPSPATSDPAAVSVGIAAPNAATERGPSLRLAAARLGPAARCWPPSARGFLNFTSLGSPVPQWTLASICCPALAWSPSAEPAAPAAAARAGAQAQLASLAWACAQPLPAGFSPLRLPLLCRPPCWRRPVCAICACRQFSLCTGACVPSRERLAALTGAAADFKSAPLPNPSQIKFHGHLTRCYISLRSFASC